MSDPQALAEAVAKAMYSRDTAVIALGMTVTKMAPGFAQVRMRVRNDMLNGHAICHGGMVFTLADTAFAYACNAQGKVTVAAGASVEFLLASREGDELTAEAREVMRSKRNGVYDVGVHNQRGELVALFRGRSHQLNEDVLESPSP
jgi:acyl-CoA thioesterase